MKKTTTPCPFRQGSSVRKRRYSSTAVGFPIRYDQKAHSQRVSEGFPSWVGARCACTYVQAHDNCALSHSERLNKSQTEAHIRLAFDAFTPNERPQNCPRKPAQRPTIHPRSTTQQRTMPHQPTHIPPTKLSWFTYGLLTVHLGVTWSSSRLIQHQCTIHSGQNHRHILVHLQFINTSTQCNNQSPLYVSSSHVKKVKRNASPFVTLVTKHTPATYKSAAQVATQNGTFIPTSFLSLTVYRTSLHKTTLPIMLTYGTSSSRIHHAHISAKSVVYS